MNPDAGPLFLIPARGGSKGIPGKNGKLFRGKPLIEYAIRTALELTEPEHICVSTDDEALADIAESCGVKVPWLRPKELATDHTGMRSVMIHALDHFGNQEHEQLVVLQPTSPFRSASHVRGAMACYDSRLDMVVSVKEAEANPYYVHSIEGDDGFLKKVAEGGFERRQDCPVVYEYNGAVFVINAASIRRGPAASFSNVKKYVMDRFSSVDLDQPIDWVFAEFLAEHGYVSC